MLGPHPEHEKPRDGDSVWLPLFPKALGGVNAVADLTADRRLWWSQKGWGAPINILGQDPRGYNLGGWPKTRHLLWHMLVFTELSPLVFLTSFLLFKKKKFRTCLFQTELKTC